MNDEKKYRRFTALKVADTLTKINHISVSPEAQELSMQWARGEITEAEMKAALIAKHMQIRIAEETDAMAQIQLEADFSKTGAKPDEADREAAMVDERLTPEEVFYDARTRIHE